MKRALVTGASGFVGRHLVERLRTDGWLVRSVGRQSLPGDHITLDLASETPNIATFEDIDTVFHLAAWQPGKGPADLAQTLNIDATERLGRLASQAGTRHLIFLSSTAAMGNAQAEPPGTAIDETTPCQPKSRYEESKYEAERRLLAFPDLNPVILRPPMIVGPGQTGGALLKMFRLCAKGRFPTFGGRTDMAKPLLHVGDLVDAVALAAGANRDAMGQTFLITSGAEHKLGDILATCASLTGRSKVARDFPLAFAQTIAAISTPLFEALGRESPLSTARLALYMADRRIDIDKAKRMLGYQPKIGDTRTLIEIAFNDYVASGQLPGQPG